MKQFRVLMLLVLTLAAARADVLRLRDGSVLTGNYVGGTQTEIWFQRSPAGAEVFPLFAVESLKFGGALGIAPQAAALKIRLVRPVRLTVPGQTSQPYRMPVMFRSFSPERPPYLTAMFIAGRFS